MSIASDCLKIAFIGKSKCVVLDSPAPDILENLESCTVFYPRIVDGFGDKYIYNKGRLEQVAEIIELEWARTPSGQRIKKSFSGIESYFIQIAINSLEFSPGNTP